MARRILVVEDDEASRELVASILNEAGYLVTEAPDGHTALAQASAAKPDLVLLDLMMPGLDGFEVCRRLRRDPATAPIPVIVLTAMGKAMDMDSAVSSGADDFVTKPIEPAALRTRVGAMLKVLTVPAGRERREAYVAELQRVRERGRALGGVACRMPSHAREQGPALLVAHGDRAALRRYTELLASAGLQLRTAEASDEALLLMQQHAVCGVVVGPQLQGRSALELLQVLRIRYPHIPVILIAGGAHPREALRAMKAGAADVLFEEDAPAELLATVHRLFPDPQGEAGPDARPAHSGPSPVAQ
jgi:two-component system, cell cycle response regulator